MAVDQAARQNVRRRVSMQGFANPNEMSELFVGRARLGTCQVRLMATVSVLVKSALGRSLRSVSPFTI